MIDNPRDDMILTDFNVKLRPVNEMSMGNSFGCISTCSCSIAVKSLMLNVTILKPFVTLKEWCILEFFPVTLQ